jgi:hypothetical protein
MGVRPLTVYCVTPVMSVVATPACTRTHQPLQ